MADQDQVIVKISASVSDLNAGMQQAAQSVRATARTIQGDAGQMSVAVRGAGTVLGQELPQHAERGHEGVSALASGLRELRQEGRQAAFLARIFGEIGIAGGAAGQALATLALSAAGGFGLVAGAELAILGVKTIVEQIQIAKEREEEAKRATEEHAAAIQKMVDGWREFNRAQQEEGTGEAGKRYAQQFAETKKEIDETTIKIIDLQAHIEEVRKHGWAPGFQLAGVFGGGGLYAEMDKLVAAQKAAQEKQRASEAGFASGRQVETLKNEETLERQRLQLAARFAGEEQRIDEEASRQKWEIKKRYEQTGGEELGRMLEAIDQDARLKKLQAEQKYSQEVAALQARSASFGGGEYQKIQVEGELEVRKLLDAQNLVRAAGDEKRVAELGREIALTRDITAERLHQLELSQLAVAAAAEEKLYREQHDAEQAAEREAAATRMRDLDAYDQIVAAHGDSRLAAELARIDKERDARVAALVAAQQAGRLSGPEAGAEVDRAFATAEREKLRAREDAEAEFTAIAEAQGNLRLAKQLEAINRERSADRQRIAEMVDVGQLDPARADAMFRQIEEGAERAKNRVRLAASEAAEPWKRDFAQGLAQSAGMAFRGITLQAQGIGQVARTVVMGVVNTFAQMGERILAEKLAELLITKTTALSEIATAAAVGGANAAAAAAATPIIGPFAAIGAGLALSSEILGTFGPMASAARGMNVPEDMIAQVHKDERILPAPDRRRMDAAFDAIERGQAPVAGGAVYHQWNFPNARLVDGAFYDEIERRVLRGIEDASARRRRR